MFVNDEGLSENGMKGLFFDTFVNSEVQTYDRKWHLTGKFTVSSLPERFAPFNVAWIKGKLYVAFAKRELGGIDEVDGKGLGDVDVFDANGNLQKQLIAQGDLNGPRGINHCAAEVRQGSPVHNFGDGKVHAYDPDTGKFLGHPQDEQ